jgi:hypothetical protein
MGRALVHLHEEAGALTQLILKSKHWIIAQQQLLQVLLTIAINPKDKSIFC